MIDNKKSIVYPKLLSKRYLIDYLEEMNFGLFGGMGDKLPLNFLEIDAFMRTTNTSLNHWEVTAMKQLSHEYIIQLQKKDNNERPPYMEVSEGQYMKQTAMSASSIARNLGVMLKK